MNEYGEERVRPSSISLASENKVKVTKVSDLFKTAKRGKKSKRFNSQPQISSDEETKTENDSVKMSDELLEQLENLSKDCDNWVVVNIDKDLTSESEVLALATKIGSQSLIDRLNQEHEEAQQEEMELIESIKNIFEEDTEDTDDTDSIVLYQAHLITEKGSQVNSIPELMAFKQWLEEFICDCKWDYNLSILLTNYMVKLCNKVFHNLSLSESYMEDLTSQIRVVLTREDYLDIIKKLAQVLEQDLSQNPNNELQQVGEVLKGLTVSIASACED